MDKKLFCIKSILIVSAFSFSMLHAMNGVNQQTATLGIPITTGVTIENPGIYRLANNLTNTQIVIDSDNVSLLFNAFSINNPSGTVTDAVLITPGHKNIVINGGEISTSVVSPLSCIHIEDGCSHIVIQNLKMSHGWYGVYCSFASVASSNIVIRSCIFSNCEIGILAQNTFNLRSNQNVIEAPLVAFGQGISLFNTEGTIIDNCSISHVSAAIFAESAVATAIKNCIINYITSISSVSETDAINLVSGNSNIIDNCEINSILATESQPHVAISLIAEDSSIVRNCVINGMFPSSGVHLQAIGIRVSDGSGYCVFENNTVANIAATASGSYGYYVDNTEAPVIFAVFDNNRALNCTNAFTQPYNGVSNTALGTQIDTYPWNWIVG